jgi:erythronate-4-phosphate dehydrogenase
LQITKVVGNDEQSIFVSTSQWPAVILYDAHIPLAQYSGIITEELMPLDGRKITKKVLLETGARALFVRSVTPINDDLIAGTSIRFVGTTTAGFEHVDIQSLRNKGIGFAYAPGSNAMPVVEYVFFALHEWINSQNQSLKGKTIGIIGMGEIGKRIAKMCRDMGMHVLASDPPLETYGLMKSEDYELTSLKDICRESDCITIHSALTHSGLFPSMNLFQDMHFSMMKPGALLIQASRGGIVNERALLNALNTNDLHLAIDVWDGEPRWNAQIANHHRAFMTTPHIAGYTSSARKRGIEMIVKQYCEFYGMECLIQHSDTEGISYQNPNAISLLRERRFAKDKMEWLKGKEVDAQMFDEGRRQFMHDQETFADISLS